MIPLPLMRVLILIGAIIALIGAVTAAWKMADSKGYARGQAETNAIWQARESKELAAANAMILIESDKARAAERKAQTAVINANEIRRKADEAAKTQVAAAANAVAASLGRMCDGRATGSESAGGGATGAIATAAIGSDAASRAEFLEVTGRFLSGEANRADEVVRKLGQAQDYIRTALATCNQ